MKKLGQGWQYTAFALGNGRVLKKYNTWPVAFWSIFKGIFPFHHYPVWKIPRYIRVIRQKAEQSIALLKNNHFPLAWFGNPTFLNGLDYEQDAATPLGKLFVKRSFSENIDLVDIFVAFNKKMMDAGVIDTHFNITKNYGLNARGEMILFDIGELLNKPEEIRAQCQKRIWTNVYVAGAIKDKKLRAYFVQQMDTYFG